MERTWIIETTDNIDQTVKLNGWVHSIRKMGDKLIFIDLRDGTGLCQIVFYKPDLDEETVKRVEELKPEYAVRIEGKVQKRGAKQVNEDLPTGTVEVGATSVTILNTSLTPPFEIDKDSSVVNEELRLKYRYLDLRTERMQRNIHMRDQITQFFRQYMHKNRFIEIETPILMKGTPEGAREFVVPSRLHAGKFYVLPQSPQQFKQLCMVAGFERYFQIARCFRDEDQRGDRQPEFTQLDFEMSFVEREDVLSYTEAMFIKLVETLFPDKCITTKPFPRFTHSEAIEKFGTDKPDLRENKEDPNELAFGWIVDFPMFETLEDGTIKSQHHPFCSIHPDDIDKLDSDPMSVRADAFDLFLNGYELSSGSIRIHKRAMQKKIFGILGIDDEEQEKRFGHMLDAFTYGAPPHGGFAPGIDRIVMLLAGEPNIREVIAFPKTGDARDPMMDAPSELEERRLRDVHIKLDVKKD